MLTHPLDAEQFVGIVGKRVDQLGFELRDLEVGIAQFLLVALDDILAHRFVLLPSFVPGSDPKIRVFFSELRELLLGLDAFGEILAPRLSIFWCRHPVLCAG